VRAPSATASRARRYGAIGTGALLGGAVAYVGLADPHNPHFVFPACPFKLLTGWNCPACGGLRMTHDLLHGDVAAAAVDNIFLLIGLPALLAWVVVRWRIGRPIFPAQAIAVIAVLAVAWTVARNMPGFPLVPTILDG
jgi:Protein of unknown function (DUF2752)